MMLTIAIRQSIITNMNSDLDKQFDLQSKYPSGRVIKSLNLFQSVIARRTMNCTINIPYGKTDGQKLDIFPAKNSNSPVFVFIHGGYFRALDKSQYSFIAPRMHRLGFTTVNINYDLAQKVEVSEIVRQCRDSFRWICDNVRDRNGDPTRIVLCGHSVGAFLVAKILEDQEACRVVDKALLLSGLYDLDPMRRSYLNQDLNLSVQDCEQLSPIHFSLQKESNVLIAVGAQETDQFIEQSQKYCSKLQNDGSSPELMVLQGINHYTMARLLVGRKNPIINWIA